MILYVLYAHDRYNCRTNSLRLKISLIMSYVLLPAAKDINMWPTSRVDVLMLSSAYSYPLIYRLRLSNMLYIK
jgi:hypothetical protein